MLTSNKYFYALILLMLIFGILAYPQLPEQVPIHWGLDGQPDRWGDRLLAILLMPALLLVIRFFMQMRISSANVTIEIFNFNVNVVATLLAYVQVLILLSAMGHDLNLPQAVIPALGIMLMLVSNVMGRVQPNWAIGVRTWWTLNNPEVWRRTHRVSARWMFLAGAVITLVGIIAPFPASIIITLGLIIGISLSVLWYSYRIHQQVTGTSA